MKPRSLLLFFLLALSLFHAFPARAQGAPGAVLVIEADGPVAPAMREYIQRGIRLAERDGAQALIIQLNTPGGAVDTMQEIVSAIRASRVPVVVYVAPRGALAGSAGTVITVAGHISAMAPETAIGAASPVGGSGEDLGETIEAKVKEALKATVRALMEGRPPAAIALAEATIEDAIAVTSAEALAAGMIDLVAADIPDLLRQLDGRTVTPADGKPRTLHTASAAVVEVRASFIEQLLAVLTDPNFVFLLLTLGVQAILIELGSPGGWVAGFVGAVCLTLAGFGLGFLEANLLGLIFLVIAFVLFIFDIKAPTHGALTTAGVASFIIGALVLFNSPGTPQFARVSVLLVVVSGVMMGGLFLVVVGFALSSQRAPVQTGTESLAGRTGRAASDINPTGFAQVGGEQWSAHLAPGGQAIPEGARLEVVGAQGVRLVVRRSGGQHAPEGE
jgi:membrane-bound serine protease (ClpP class)